MQGLFSKVLQLGSGRTSSSTLMVQDQFSCQPQVVRGKVGSASFSCPCPHEAEKGKGKASSHTLVPSEWFTSTPAMWLALLCCPGGVQGPISQVLQPVRGRTKSPAPLTPGPVLPPTRFYLFLIFYFIDLFLDVNYFLLSVFGLIFPKALRCIIKLFT